MKTLTSYKYDSKAKSLKFTIDARHMQWLMVRETGGIKKIYAKKCQSLSDIDKQFYINLYNKVSEFTFSGKNTIIEKDENGRIDLKSDNMHMKFNLYSNTTVFENMHESYLDVSDIDIFASEVSEFSDMVFDFVKSGS